MPGNLLPGEPRDLVVLGQLDGVAGARLLAHAAVDAPKLVDVKLLGVLLAVRPGRFFGDDVYAVGRAGRRAHEARWTGVRISSRSFVNMWGALVAVGTATRSSSRPPI